MSECLPDIPRYIRTRGYEWHCADHKDGPWRPIPAPQPGVPWPYIGPPVLESGPPSAAADLVAAFDDRFENCGPFDRNWQEVCLAAVLRHLAANHGDPESFGAVRPELLEQLAAELEGMS